MSDGADIGEGLMRRIVALHHALSHATRLRIIEALSREGEITPNEFADPLERCFSPNQIGF